MDQYGFNFDDNDSFNYYEKLWSKLKDDYRVAESEPSPEKCAYYWLLVDTLDVITSVTKLGGTEIGFVLFILELKE